MRSFSARASFSRGAAGVHRLLPHSLRARSSCPIRSPSSPSGSRSLASISSRMLLMRSMVERMSVTASVGDRHAVAELAHQRLGGMRQRFQPGQAEKAAGALDGMDEAKDVAEDLAVVRLLLEAHEFGVDPIETLVGLGQEFPQQVVHTRRLSHTALLPARRIPLRQRARQTRALTARRRAPDRNAASVLPKGLISVAGTDNAAERRGRSPPRNALTATVSGRLKPTASPSPPAESASPQSRARMPA